MNVVEKMAKNSSLKWVFSLKFEKRLEAVGKFQKFCPLPQTAPIECRSYVIYYLCIYLISLCVGHDSGCNLQNEDHEHQERILHW